MRTVSFALIGAVAITLALWAFVGGHVDLSERGIRGSVRDEEGYRAIGIGPLPGATAGVLHDVTQARNWRCVVEGVVQERRGGPR